MSHLHSSCSAPEAALGTGFGCEHSPNGGPMVDLQVLTFPFHGEVRPGESGQGYALRMAAENRLNGLPQLKSLLGKSRYATLDAADTPLLHRWFGADKKALDRALGWTHTGQSSGGYVYAGQAIGRSYFLNRSYPRICFMCLKAQGYIPAVWDFSLNTACTRHGDVLADACPNCIRPISWNRPAPFICNCHLEFSGQVEPTKATRLEIEFSIWCEQRSCSASRTTTVGDRSDECVNAHQGALDPLMRLIWPLSLSGGMHVTYALAAAASYERSLVQTKPRPKTALKKAQEILNKANEFAGLIRSGEPQLRVQRPSVVIQLLADCMTGNTFPADRHLAQSLLATVLHQKRKSRWSGVNPQLSQLTLF